MTPERTTPYPSPVPGVQQPDPPFQQPVCIEDVEKDDREQHHKWGGPQLERDERSTDKQPIYRREWDRAGRGYAMI